jgi:hypothetical protein
LFEHAPVLFENGDDLVGLRILLKFLRVVVRMLAPVTAKLSVASAGLDFASTLNTFHN